MNIGNLIELRRTLHQNPELSGKERMTASRIFQWLQSCKGAHKISNIGGNGIAAIFDSKYAGDTILFRCELDALPIMETGTPMWRSKVDNVGHLCGHDGHMAIIAGLARELSETPPKKGRIILLFQPAEETGAGARAIIDDEKFAAIKPDYAYALHNLPGLALGEVGIKSGPFNFASEGIIINLTGMTSHASHPEDAISPTLAVSEIISRLPDMPNALGLDEGTALVTIAHAKIGNAAFGITPGDATVYAAVRSITDEIQTNLMAAIEERVSNIADTHGLKITIGKAEKFVSCQNDDDATTRIENAAKALGVKVHTYDKPFRWSEDFGLFGSVSKASLLVMGAGVDHPQLHASDYDFPESIIPISIKLFEKIARDHCG